MGWFLVNFALFVSGLVFFAARPTRQALSQRHVRIKRAISDAATKHAKAASDHHSWRDKLANLDAQVRATHTAAVQDGAQEEAKLVQDAEAYAARMRIDGQNLQAQEDVRARLRLQNTIAWQTLAKVHHVLDQQLQAADQQRLIEQGIDAVASLASPVSRLPSMPGAAAGEPGGGAL